MIKVENLTKRYAGQTAIRDLNFEVGQGEIMGFLGPNGAGKTTTMRILAGFMPATSGRASIAGFDVFEQSLQARSRLGYMPENVPLYNDMRVTEYLDYRAALKGVPHRRVAERVGDVKELCGLREVERKLIGALSKGYRQRVGLADALVNEPELLILDEPTIGLDPNQIRQVRELIKNLGKQHTILLSTHILPEVEMTCSRVIIIHKGRIEACDTPDNLLGQIRQAGGVVVEAKTGKDDGAEELRKISGVREVTVEQEDGWITHDCAAEGHALTLAAGERPRLALEEAFDPQNTGGFVHPPANFLLRQFAQRKTKGHVVVDSHVRIKGVGLEDHRDVTVLGRNVINQPVANEDATFGYLLKAGQEPQRGRFSRPFQETRALGQAPRAIVVEHDLERGIEDDDVVAGGHEYYRLRCPSVCRSLPSGCAATSSESSSASGQPSSWRRPAALN